MLILMVAVGGAVGAVARYGLSGWVQGFPTTSFPLGTLVVNVLGSFLLGFVFYLLEALALSAETRSMVTIGFLGSFTTFSTFSFETVALLQEGQWLRAGLYAGGSVALGLIAMVAGMALATAFARAGGAA